MKDGRKRCGVQVVAVLSIREKWTRGRGWGAESVGGESAVQHGEAKDEGSRRGGGRQPDIAVIFYCNN